MMLSKVMFLINVCLYRMILVQYLHQLGKKCDISLAIVISAGWDPFLSKKSFAKIVNKTLYSRPMIRSIKHYLVRK